MLRLAKSLPLGLFSFPLISVFAPDIAFAQNPAALNAARVEEGLADVEEQIDVGSEPARPADAAPDVRPFILSGVQIAGSEGPVPPTVAAAYEPYLATLVGPQDLLDLLGAVTAAYESAGHTMTRVTIPPQAARGGILRLQVDQGRIGEVRITRGDEAAPEYDAFFSFASADRPWEGSRLKHAVLMLEDLPEVGEVNAQLVPDAANAGLYALEVDVTEEDADNFLVLDGYGSDSVGPLRAYGLFSTNRLLAPGDEWKLRIATVPDRPQEFVTGALDGEFALGGGGDRIGFDIGASRIEPGGVDGTGRSVRGGVRFETPLGRERHSGTWLTVGLDLRDNKFKRGGRMSRKDSIRAARAGVYSYRRTHDARIRMDAVLSQGLSVLGATEAGEALSSRPDAEPGFTTLRVNAGYRRELSANWQLDLDGTGQLSSGPLLSSEQFFLGGAILGHAYDDGDISGDDGIGGSITISNTIPVSQGRDYVILSALAEAGMADYRRIDGLAAQSLSSASLGARWLTGDLDLGAELAIPLHIDSPFETDSDDIRFRFRAIYRL